MSAQESQDPILRRHFIAIATSEYAHPELPTLAGVQEEVGIMKDWLCSPDLAPRAFIPHEELSLNPTMEAVEKAFKQRESPWGDSDAVMVYVTGHGIVADDDHMIALKATDKNRPKSTALRTADLLSWLLESHPDCHLLVVLDMCFAEKTTNAVVKFDKRFPDNWVVLAGAAKNQEAITGALTSAVTKYIKYLKDPIGGGIRGPQIELLHVDDFLKGVDAQLTPGQELVPVGNFQLSGSHPCLPNPHYRPLPDLETHWEPRSRGVAQATEQTGWLFTGRSRLMQDLITAATGPVGTWLVTGGAGSGKSAALARLVTLSETSFRTRYQAHVKAVPPESLPPEGAVDVAVLAAGKIPHDVIAEICTHVGLHAPPAAHSLDAWIATWHRWLVERREPVTVVVDALDEATDPHSVLTTLLVRLDPEHTRLRLIIGVRSPGGDETDPAAVDRGMPLADLAEQQLTAARIRVDEPPWWQPSDLADYAVSILTTASRTPYTNRDVARAVAGALARHARTSFLVTQIAATSLSHLGKQPVDPDDPAWLATIDDGVLGVFRADLQYHCPTPEQRLQAVHLLRAVAFARGRGLPWLGLWPAFANAVANDPTRTYGDTDIAELLASPLGGYLSTSTADGTTVYSLFHDALNTTLRERWRDLLLDTSEGEVPKL